LLRIEIIKQERNNPMTARELKYMYIEEAMSILDNEELMEKVLKAIRRCKKAIKAVQKEDEEDFISGGVSALQFTREEQIAELRESEEDYKAGRFRSSEEVFRSLEEKYPFLCE
jgi:predicted transcriptional regulator